MANKDVAILSQWLQYIMLHIHQYCLCIFTGLSLNYIEWIGYPTTTMHRTGTRNHGMNINMHTIRTTMDILICMPIEARNEDAE